MNTGLTFLWATLLVSGSLLSSCGTTAPADTPDQPKKEAVGKETPPPAQPVASPGAPAPAGGREAAQNTPKQDEPLQKPEGQDDDPKKILEKHLKDQALTEQEKRLQSQQHYQEGLTYYNGNDFEKAKRSLDKSLEVWPHNDEARALLNKVNQLLGFPSGEFAALPEDAKNDWLRRMQQTIIEIRRGILDGERYYRAEKYDEALRELKQAEFRLANFPYELDIKNLLPRTRALINEVEYAKKKSAEASEDRKRAESLEENRKLAEAQRKEVLMMIRQRLELAFNAFDQKRYDRCIQLCNEILAIDPHYKVAKELFEDAQKTRHNVIRRETLHKKILAWKDMMAESTELVIPYAEFVQFPPPKVWNEVKKRAEYTLQVEQTEQEDIDILNINSTLEMTKLATPPQLERTTLKEALNFIRSQTKLNIYEDPAIAEITKREDRITFKFTTPIAVKTMLTTLLSNYGLEYVIKDKSVFISKAGIADGPIQVRVYDMNLVLPKPADFPERFTGLKPTMNTRNSVSAVNFQYTPPAARENRPAFTSEDVKKTIMSIVAPGTWDENKSRTIVVTPNNQMVVSHTQAAQQQVQRVVDNIKSYAATQVLVEARFIMADDNFLEELGIDWRDHPAAATGVIDDGTGVVTGTIDRFAPDAPASKTVDGGILVQEFARQEAWDLRAQTYHTWMRNPSEPWFVFGNRITNQGGIGLVMRWMGEQQMQAVMRAVWKGEKATLLHNPKLMIFNGQRSHIVILKQTAFIQSLDVAAGAIGGALDPAIGVINDGVVLDVRPIVSHDRKWVTMEIQPTLSMLVGMRSVGTAGASPELPQIMFQRVQTTVTVPDKGTMILAGLKDIYRREINADTPFLGNIPIVQILASRKGKNEEHRNILIMATPHIIDMNEYEEGRAPGQVPSYAPEIPIHPAGY